MKVSYKWLKEYIHTDLAIDKVSELLTDTGLEVEGIEEIESIKGGLKGVVIGEILSCEPHPNADRLRKTTVSIGGGEPLPIVCGAPNVAVGLKVLIATVGTIIYSEEGDFTIKKSKIRGEVSEGMICAEDELNIGESHDGIMVLTDNPKVGTPAAEYFKIESDHVIEIGLTPNRSDAMSHYGVARDLKAALLRYELEDPKLELPSVDHFTVASNDLEIGITIEDKESCPRYAGTSIKGVKIGPSPEWIQSRLRAIGVGPINNVVDIANYVLHETGHPLHAFDADKVEGHQIVVKHLAKGTKFVTLDDKERELHEDDLMICNTSEGMVIAGTMGGKHSGVSKDTQNVFIEAAYFNPVSVRKTAKRHALNTDSSFRYERGVDPNMTIYALKRAALLIQEIAGGEVSMEIKDVYPNPIPDFTVELNLDRMNHLIGQEIPEDQVKAILSSLDIDVISQSEKDLTLNVPAYRVDVQREADIVEEVLRIYGFNAIDFNHKMSISVAQTDSKSEASYREKMSTVLSGRGFSEIMNNSLTKPHYYDGNGYVSENSIAMLNPLSQDLAVMRQALIFGGLEVIAYNSNRQRPNLKLYEFGKTYQKHKEAYSEETRFGIWISGSEKPEGWSSKSAPSDFFTLKAEVVNILAQLGFKNLVEQETEGSEVWSYGLELVLNNKVVATVGKVTESLQKKTDNRHEVFYADLDWEYLTKKAKKLKVMFQELPKYPEVRRDLALLVNEDVKYADLKTAAQKCEKKILRNINLFDVYEGKNLAAGKKSYAMSFTLRDDSQTLKDAHVDKVMSKILSSLKAQFNVELR